MARAAAKLGPEWPAEVDGFRLSELAGVSVRYLRDLKKKGIVFEGSRPGMYQFPESLHCYIACKQKMIAETGALSPLTVERAKSAVVNRQIKEHELADMQSDLLTKIEVEASWKTFAAGMKHALLSIPTEFVKALPHLTAHDEQHLRTLTIDMLDDLAREAEDGIIGGDPDLLRATKDERAGIKPRRRRT